MTALATAQRNNESTESLEYARALLRRIKRAVQEAVEVRLDPEEVRPMKGQPRKHFSEEQLAGLEESIRSVGQLYPGLVRKKGRHYELLDGECRLRVVSRIPGEVYRALCIDLPDDAAPRFLVAVIANANRANLSIPELIDAATYLYDELRLPIEEVARGIGVNVPKAYRLLRLRLLPPEVRALLDPTLPKEERLTFSNAEIVAKEHPHDQLLFAQSIVAGRKVRAQSSTRGSKRKKVAQQSALSVSLDNLAVAADHLWRLVHGDNFSDVLKRDPSIANATVVTERLAGITSTLQECGRETKKLT